MAPQKKGEKKKYVIYRQSFKPWENKKNLLIMELQRAFLCLTHIHTPVSLPFFLSISASFSGSRLISFPQPAVSISPAERAPPTPESYASFLRLFLSRRRTQWRATTSRSLCLSAPNWPGAAEGPRGRCRAGAGRFCSRLAAQIIGRR